MNRDLGRDHHNAVQVAQLTKHVWKQHRVNCKSCERKKALWPEETFRCFVGNALFREHLRTERESTEIRRALEKLRNPTHRRILKWTSVK